MPGADPQPTAHAPRPARARLVLLCGRSFSGKSSAAAALRQSLPARVVSLDAINAERGLDGGQGISVQEWSRTHDEAEARVRQLLAVGATVVVDDTASPRSLRDRWREVADRAGAAFALVFVDTPLETIRARLARNRDSAERRDVLDAVMAEHLASFEEPGSDEGALVLDGGDHSPQDLAAAVRSALHAQEQLWVALVHVRPTGPLAEEFEGAAGAYLHVATPGASPLDAQQRLSAYFTTRGWGLQGVEEFHEAEAWLRGRIPDPEVAAALAEAQASRRTVPVETWDLYE